jgi:lipid-A-disaccharide synthase
VHPDVLGPAVLEQLERPDRAELVATFTEMHHALRRDASARAAEAILELRERRRMPA